MTNAFPLALDTSSPFAWREELGGALLLVALFGVLIAVAEILARRTRIPAEWSRKLVHLGGGLGCLLFPLLVSRAWTVLVLALCFGSVFWWAERAGWLQCLCRVTRRSHGSVYYPFAIAGLFALTADRYGLYLSAVLVLTVSDTAAALVGSRFGRVHYRTGQIGERKSLEGSLIFGILTFLMVLLPLLWWGETGWSQAWLAALLTAGLLTTVEAVATGGRDNLYVPMLAAFLLLKVVTKPVGELAMQSVSMVLLFSGLFLLNYYGRILRVRALLIMGIIAYGVWSLGSVDWAVPLLTAFAWFAVVFIATGMEQRRSLAYRRLPLLAIPAVVLTLTANLTGTFAFWYGPYLVAVLIPLAWGVVVQLTDSHVLPSFRWTWPQFGAAAMGVVLSLAEPLLLGRAPDGTTVLVIATGSLTMTWLGLGLTSVWSRFGGSTSVIIITCTAIAFTIAGQTSGVLTEWEPMRWADVYGREADVLFPLK
jgi:phytol kinase